MKVLLIGRVSQSLGGKAIGGISKHIEDLTFYLNLKGHKVSVWDFTLSKSIDKGEISFIGTSPIKGILNLFISLTNLKVWLCSHLTIKEKIIVGVQFRSIKRLFKSREFDIIHVHSLNRPIIYFLREFNIPIVVTDHGFWQNKYIETENNKVVKSKLEKNLSVSEKLIAISQFSILKQKEHRLFEKNKSVFIPNPIDLNKIPFTERIPKPKRIFFNGFTESVKIKGLEIVLESMLQLDNSYELVAIANEEGRKLMEKYRGRLNLSILGSQSWSSVLELYNSSSVFVLPSRSESFGLVYLEALACGVPIIGFKGACDEFQKVLETDIGETFDWSVENPHDLSDKIRKVLNTNYDSKLIREKLEKHYGWQDQIKSFEDCYHSVLRV